MRKPSAKYFRAAEGHDVLLSINRQRCVLNERVEYVNGHALIYVPVARFILKAGEEKLTLIARHIPTSNLTDAVVRTG